jgi:diacylglycerol O-acyltransferase / wax synthase
VTVNRLSGMDAVSLSIEKSTAPVHVVAVAVLAASDRLSHKRLHELVGSSLPLLARFRSRVVGKPLGLGQPLWAEIDDFDPSAHMHSVTLPAPGTRRGFSDLIAGLTARPLDRRGPLWEMWSIDGLEAGRWALALKMAPAVTGGVAGLTAVWRGLFDLSPQHDPIAVARAEPSLGRPPSIGGLITDTMRELLENQITGAWLIAAAAPGALRSAMGRPDRGLHDQLPRTPSSMQGPLPRTVFNLPLTHRRAIALASIPLAQMRTVTRAFGGDLDNVFLAACTLALRAWLQRHDTVPDYPLSVGIPLSLRGAGSKSSSNHTTFGRLRLPVQLDDPVQVLSDLHTATEKLKMAGRSKADAVGPVADFATVASLFPPAVVHAGMQLYSGLGLSQRLVPISHGMVSILPGPRVPLFCAGAQVVGMHTATPLMEGAGLNITLITHGSVGDLSVCVCPDNVPAVDEIAIGIAESVGILAAAAERSPRGVSPSVLSEMTSHAKKRPHARR